VARIDHVRRRDRRQGEGDDLTMVSTSAAICGGWRRETGEAITIENSLTCARLIAAAGWS